MSCSVDHYFSDADVPNDPGDPDNPIIVPQNRALNGDNSIFPHGVKLFRAKDREGELSMYYKDFFVESDSAMDFIIEVNDSSSFGKAMKVTQTLAYGKRYVEEMTGDAMEIYETYKAFYPCSGNRSYYATKGSANPSDNMYISEEDYANPDVILHEYGRCVQRKYGFGDSLGVPHYLGINNSSLLENQYDGVRLAWGEAWPTVFANLVTQRYPSFFFGLNGTIDKTFDSHDCSFSLEAPTMKIGHESEEDIAAVLYDLFDSNDSTETFDNLHYDHKGLWDLMIDASQSNNGLKTFVDFFNYYESNMPSADVERLKRIIREYGFSPEPTTNGNGTINSGPTIYWDSVSSAYNYDIFLYNGYGTKLFTRTSNTNYYTINYSDWQTILLSPTSGWYYEIVANVMVNYAIYHYGSGRISMTKPTGVSDGGLLQIDNTYKNRIATAEIKNLVPDSAKQYTFRTTSAGNMTFQTVGPYGSRIELYDSNNNLVATGIGGMYGKGYGSNGRQRNGFIRYYCKANTDYKLLIRDCDGGRVYNGTLIIMQAYAYTKGSSSYDSAYSLQEMVSNNGTYEVNVYQKKVSIFNYIPASGIGTFTAELSSALDTYIYVIDTMNGVIHQNDDDGEDGNAKISFPAMSGWYYLIMVTQYNPMNNPYSNRKVNVHIWKN